MMRFGRVPAPVLSQLMQRRRPADGYRPTGDPVRGLGVGDGASCTEFESRRAGSSRLEAAGDAIRAAASDRVADRFGESAKVELAETGCRTASAARAQATGYQLRFSIAGKAAKRGAVVSVVQRSGGVSLLTSARGSRRRGPDRRRQQAGREDAGGRPQPGGPSMGRCGQALLRLKGRRFSQAGRAPKGRGGRPWTRL